MELNYPFNRKICPPTEETRTTAKIAIVGEQPGAQEMIQREPWVGPAGIQLWECASVPGIARGDCYLTNVVKDLDYPIDFFVDTQRGIFKPDGKAYIELLKEELNHTYANVIVAAGNVALLALTDRVGITKWRGSLIESTLLPGRKVIPIFHPSTILPKEGRPGTYINRHLISLDLAKVKRESEFPEIRAIKRYIITGPSYFETLEFLDKVKTARGTGIVIDFDIEVVNEELHCISFAISPTYAISIPFFANENYFTPDEEANIISVIASILSDESIVKGGQNLAFDIQFMLSRYKIVTRGDIHDTMIAQKISMPDFPAGLDFITSVHTDIPYYKADGKKWLKVGGSSNQFWQYNALDSVACQEARSSQFEDLVRTNNERTYDRQRKLIYPLVYMMNRGIRVDVEGLVKEAEKTRDEVKRVEQELWDKVGYQINHNSPKQIQNYFYDQLGIKPYKKRTKKGSKPTVDEDALKRIARRGYSEADTILKLRGLDKRLSVYLNVSKIDADGRYRSSYNPVGAETGRLSSSENIFGTGGNQQNWPHDLLRYLIADEGYAYYNLDLAQIEMRIVAYVGRISQMIEAFENDVDLHKLTASLIFGKPYHQISDEPGSSSLAGGKYSERFWGKKANHGLDYDLGYKAFSIKCELPEAEGKFIHSRFHEGYPGIRGSYHALVRNMLKDNNRMITNLYGRNRLFLGRWGDDLFREAYAQIPQSTVADRINEDGIIYIYYNQQHFEQAELLNQIHDSIGLQIPLSLPWERHAEILLKIRASLSKKLVWNNREFDAPVDLTIGLNLCKEEGIEMKYKETPTNPTILAEKLHTSYNELIEREQTSR